MSKKRTMRELHEFMQQRAMKITMWRNARGLSIPEFAAMLNVSAPRVRSYEGGSWIPASRLRLMQKAGVPSVILYLDGSVLHEIIIQQQ